MDEQTLCNRIILGFNLSTMDVEFHRYSTIIDNKTK